MAAVMTREPDDARGGARGSSAFAPRGGATPPPAVVELRRAAPAGDPEPGELGFPPEADTLTTHDAPVLPRRDTTPAPPVDAAPEAAPSSDVLGDDDILEDPRDPDDDTQTQIEPREAPDEPTSPTLSLANRSDATREVYRLFLASDYAPALELADELIARGELDPMLVTIARECRSSIAALSSAPPGLAAAARPVVTAGMFDATMTIEDVAAMTGAPVEQVLGLLERFVAMGVLSPRVER